MKHLFIFLCISTIAIAQKKPLKDLDIDSIIKTNVDTITDSNKKIDKLISLTREYRYTKSTKKFINRALSISLKLNNTLQIANSYYTQGNYYYYNSSLDSSLYSLNKAQEFIPPKKHLVLKASIISTKGGVYQKKGDISKAISLLLDAKIIVEKIDTLQVSNEEIKKVKSQNLIINNSLANLYNQMEEYDESLNYYEKAINSAIDFGSDINAGVILSNKGDLLLKIGRYEEALKILQQSKSLKEKGKAPLRLIAGSDLNIGIAFFKLNNYDLALENLNKATKTYETIENQTGLIYSYTHRGILYNELKNYNLAKIDCEKAKELAINQKELDYQSKSCECLYESYKQLGDFKKALSNFEFYLKTKDSIYNEKNVKKFTQLQMQYEFDKKQELQKIEIEKTDQQRKYYLYLSLAGLIIASLLGFFYFKNRKKNKLLAKQKKMLEITVDEKNVLLKETHHRVKNSFQIVSSLLYLQSENITDKEAQIAIKEAQNRVRSMVLIHQKLYSKDQLVGIDTKEYFTDLVNDIIESHQFSDHPLSYQLDVDSFVLNIETITPLGLILNELIVNVLKHAFTKIDEKSHMRITFKKMGEKLVLQVNDNGKGLQGEIKETSFGIKLIKALSRKLKATLSFETNEEEGTNAMLEVSRFQIL